MWGEMGEADADAGEDPDEEANDAAYTAPPEAETPMTSSAKKSLTTCRMAQGGDSTCRGTRAVTFRHKAHLTPTRRITRRQQGCQPLSEHHDELALARARGSQSVPRMLIWHRVQELDVHISTPGHTPQILRLPRKFEGFADTSS